MKEVTKFSKNARGNRNDSNAKAHKIGWKFEKTKFV